MSDLDALFEKHAARKKKEQESRDAELASQRARGEDAVAVFEKNVIPTLQEVANEITKKGHKAEAGGNLNTDFPSATLSFALTSWQFHSNASGLLKLSYSGDNRVVIERTVRGREDDRMSRNVLGGNESTWMLEEITPNKVRSEAVSFVGSVLNAS
jgi:hypothetical protein